MKKILVVDDEKPISDIIKFNLEKEGFEVITAFDGEEALNKVKSELPSLVILDVMLPKMDGLEVVREIRKEFTMPVIMVTAKETEIDKVLGLELGADDYVTKPFSNRELIARVKANLRREMITDPIIEKKLENNDIDVGELTIHPEAYSVSKNGETIELTHREFELIYYLAQNIDHVITRESLLEEVWDFDYLGDVRTVDVTIRRLREKVEDNPSHPSYIITRRGVGYYLKNPNKMEN